MLRVRGRQIGLEGRAVAPLMLADRAAPGGSSSRGGDSAAGSALTAETAYSASAWTATARSTAALGRLTV